MRDFSRWVIAMARSYSATNVARLWSIKSRALNVRGWIKTVCLYFTMSIFKITDVFYIILQPFCAFIQSLHWLLSPRVQVCVEK